MPFFMTLLSFSLLLVESAVSKGNDRIQCMQILEGMWRTTLDHEFSSVSDVAN